MGLQEFKERINMTDNNELTYNEEGNIVAAPVETPYDANRQMAYPNIGEQLDMLWHAMDADESKRLEPFYSSIKEVKEEFPKP